MRLGIGSASARLAVPLAMVAVVVAAPAPAQAASSCSSGGSHTVCVTAPDVPLVGAVPITVTNTPNNGNVTATWIPSGGSAFTLIQQFAPSPITGDYSFTWPTEKYLDASGTLRVAYGSSQAEVSVTLSNGNTSDFQHSPSDWASYLPNPSWTLEREPVIAAVGDGASGEQVPADNAAAIAAASPDVFLYLGDIYETGTFTELLNHYGENSMDGGPGTFWGQMGSITQPAIGDHEAANKVAWQDYFHGRPLYTSFLLGNVLFLDLDSQQSMKVGSAEYNYVQSVLTSPSTPACVVTYFQNPALAKNKINAKRTDMWALLTHNGGDLVLNGNSHTMINYKPLNDHLQLPSAGEDTMIELIDGAGGHIVGGPYTSDSRVEWSKGKTPGAIWITPNGSANGGTPTSLNWAYKDDNGTVLHSGTRDCGGGPPPPPGPSITGFSPASGPVGISVTIDGTHFTGATDVSFGGTSAGTGNFTVDSDSQITATVPQGATTGPIAVTTPDGTGTSSTDFTVASGVLTFAPDADTTLKSGAPDKNFGTTTSFSVDASPIKDGLLMFTVSGIGSSTIASVKLRLYCLDPATLGGDFYPVSDNTWSETTVTYNNAPAAGAGPIASLGAVALNTWAEVDLTGYITGDGTYSLEVASTSDNGADYSTKEGVAGLAPTLVVTLS